MLFWGVMKFPVAAHTAAERADKRVQLIEAYDFNKLVIRVACPHKTAMEYVSVPEQVAVAAEEESLLVSSHPDQFRVGYPRRRKRVETGHA